VPLIFHIPGALGEYAGGHRKVVIQHTPATVADALSALWLLHPGLRDRILTEQGQLREHINIFIGDENVRYSGGLTSPVSSGSEISIVPAISGGLDDSDRELIPPSPMKSPSTVEQASRTVNFTQNPTAKDDEWKRTMSGIGIFRQIPLKYSQNLRDAPLSGRSGRRNSLPFLSRG
jgi:sulfur-carrier protein